MTSHPRGRPLAPSTTALARRKGTIPDSTPGSQFPQQRWEMADGDSPSEATAIRSNCGKLFLSYPFRASLRPTLYPTPRHQSARAPEQRNQAAIQRRRDFPQSRGGVTAGGRRALGQDDEWTVAERRYFSAESMKQLHTPELAATTQEILATIM